MSQQAVLYRMVKPKHLCPFGLKAKDLLVRHGFEVDDQHLTSDAATAAFKSEHQVSTTPQIFIDGVRIGGYDALREHLGLTAPTDTADAPSYQPVIAVFATTLLMGLATVWGQQTGFSIGPVLEHFVAYSMCVLAILKLRDLDAFANQFITYDLLAMRLLRYAYVYPFAEAFVGIGMLSTVAAPWVATVALFIGSIGACSVIKAVYIDKRELQCACVGGDSKVPLGFISLTENLMMVSMAIWMLLR